MTLSRCDFSTASRPSSRVNRAGKASSVAISPIRRNTAACSLGSRLPTWPRSRPTLRRSLCSDKTSTIAGFENSSSPSILTSWLTLYRVLDRNAFAVALTMRGSSFVRPRAISGKVLSLSRPESTSTKDSVCDRLEALSASRILGIAPTPRALSFFNDLRASAPPRSDSARICVMSLSALNAVIKFIR